MRWHTYIRLRKMLKCNMYFNLEARALHFHFTNTRHCTVSRCYAWQCFMSPIIGIDSDPVVITGPLILQSNSICANGLYSFVIVVTVRLRNCVSIPEKSQKVFFSLKCTERLSNPHSLLFNGYRRPIARIKLLGSEVLHSPLSSVKYNT
jgi:hypothetical protein